MKMFKHTAYYIIGAAAFLSLAACSPDEVELEPVPFELSYSIYSEYSYDSNETTFNVNAVAGAITLGSSNDEYKNVNINLRSNLDPSAKIIYDIETPDWVTDNSNYLALAHSYGGNLCYARLYWFGNTYNCTIRVNGKEYNKSYTDQIEFAFAPNPGSNARSGEFKITVDYGGTIGNISVPFTQAGNVSAVAPSAISFSETTSPYGETLYQVNVDFSDAYNSENYSFMITPVPPTVGPQNSTLESVLRCMGAYECLLSQSYYLLACKYFEDVSRDHFLGYNPVEYYDRKSNNIPGGIRYYCTYYNADQFNGYSRYAVYTVTKNEYNNPAAFSVTYFDANGNIVE